MLCVRKILNIAQRNLQVRIKVDTVYKSSGILLQNIICRLNHDSEEYISAEDEGQQDAYSEIASRYLSIAVGGHRTFILQPYIKWGRDKKRNTSPELQMAEAVALINTLPNWCVVGTKYAPLLTLQKKQLLGTGAMKDLKTELHKCQPTAVFISTNLLKFVQIIELEKIFNLPVYDRYSIVIHIFREHAKTAEAKLQVALAEIPYIRKKILETSITRSGAVNMTEEAKLLLDGKEKKLKNELKKLKQHRQTIRSQRKKRGFPTVAVVGYTNAGKTSLIKALTDDSSLQPKDKLFATLDTTAHQGILPNKLKVLYMDTIGFIQDVPETLIEPFIVTLEDAIIADVIVHIYDVSHPDMKAQYQHIQETIKPMLDDRPIIDVANKCDLVESDYIPKDAIAVSAKNLTGIDLLRFKIQEVLLATTGLLSIRARVKSGSSAASWLYKMTTVINAESDPNDAQYLIMEVLTTSVDIQKFKKFLATNNLKQ
ncbi:putative GTP-binding protein 6 [Solenopsis invicta]|uniref:putative GTP-binding protein 6 n=1 Tax=Solenopsis invicta TaxID=13686 RepID=UPI00193CBB27|nr:putative GTP-binding protein 6 [Solenopsis invicta]XP_025987975.2 putative GTP-binding protein 6 [Solenopsis invicta]XP_039304577.1 putative GTP-binding protein 6 [Solenopsis invicta]XP_039304582.1 putative GTP-binding protein 6 [Solenopsis invicta]XP_039304587.1 putative GTP-binding protein 6 [Solenopsis invicta]XP_039304593.1 putative GTP-binding protein 6 [Solenopsis invicta]XP_039304595.1 putative GTP-binding protein 6 [Solenopsis invicta]